jgi:Domain of unknown function (DUF6431)
MQLICAIDIDPEQYVAEGFHKRMLPPARCPHCYRAKTLWALGYYSRHLSRIGLGALLIFVRRFLCRCCRKTVSLLPSFAQPYRFVQNRTIENYLRGNPLSDEVIRHLDLLSQYWRRFRIWLPELERTVGDALERAPPNDHIKAWRLLLAVHGDLASTTQNLVTGFQITPFGRYRCHRPNGPEEKMVRKR